MVALWGLWEWGTAPSNALTRLVNWVHVQARAFLPQQPKPASTASKTASGKSGSVKLGVIPTSDGDIGFTNHVTGCKKACSHLDAAAFLRRAAKQ